jgi:uncharacterized protein (DUF488 family)
MNHTNRSLPAIMIEVTRLLLTFHINKSIITLEAVLQQTGHCYSVASILHTAKSWGSRNPAIIIPKTVVAGSTEFLAIDVGIYFIYLI